MNIRDDFIRDNNRISIISNGGAPFPIPKDWQPVLGTCDLMVVIPDMHMFYYSSPLDRFRAGAATMLDFLGYLETLKRRLASSGNSLQIYQMGDLYELRYPSPRSGLRITPREIRQSHPAYDAIANRLFSLGARIIYGNHDYEQRRGINALFNAVEGKIYLEHGFAAEPWYRFANPHLPFWGLSMKLLFLYRRMQMKLHGWKYRHSGPLTPNNSVRRVPAISDRYPLLSLAYYRRLLSRLRIGDDSPRVCIVGHSHRPYVDSNFAGGSAIFVDAGSWTDGHSSFAVVTNEELALCRYEHAGLPVSEETRREAV